MNRYHTIETPRSAPGAIAMIRVVHPEPQTIGLINPQIGQVLLSKLFDIDEGVVLRLDIHSLVLMPHGGTAIVRKISAMLEQLGVPHRDQSDPLKVYPEAESPIEASMLSMIARCSSPLGVDLLLDQPKRWKSNRINTLEQAIVFAQQKDRVADSRVLDRLVHPPVVAAIGRANVGKSTLINTLVGEQVALVADVAGTTRDHVGVLVDLGGLVVRWIDTPGIDERIPDGDEIEIARQIVAKADCVVHCIDSQDDAGILDDRLDTVVGASTIKIRVGMRSDLGEHGCQVDLRVSMDQSRQPEGLESLVTRIQASLIPAQALQDPRPWVFWEGIDDATTQ